jgi:hypothetical protein
MVWIPKLRIGEEGKKKFHIRIFFFQPFGLKMVNALKNLDTSNE